MVRLTVCLEWSLHRAPGIDVIKGQLPAIAKENNDVHVVVPAAQIVVSGDKPKAQDNLCVSRQKRTE